MALDNQLENSNLESATESSQVSQNSIDTNIGRTDVYNCPACDQVAEDDTIVCEECNEWFHFHCVGVDPSKADDIPEDTLFVCIFCNDNLINAEAELTLEKN